MTTRDHQVERFDRWAETYDRSFLQRRVFEPVHEALIQALGSVEGWRVLDVGCGTGTLTVALARRSARAIGVDPAPRMVAQARAKQEGAPVTFIVGSAEALPFADSSFDGATASSRFTTGGTRSAGWPSWLGYFGRVAARRSPTSTSRAPFGPFFGS